MYKYLTIEEFRRLSGFEIERIDNKTLKFNGFSFFNVTRIAAHVGWRIVEGNSGDPVRTDVRGRKIFVSTDLTDLRSIVHITTDTGFLVPPFKIVGGLLIDSKGSSYCTKTGAQAFVTYGLKTTDGQKEVAVATTEGFEVAKPYDPHDVAEWLKTKCSLVLTLLKV